MKEIVLRIRGMHCGSCVRRVTEGLSNLEGVTVDSVEIGTAKLKQPEGDSLDRVYAAIRKLGFEPAGELG